MRIKLMIVMAVVIVALAAACHLLWRRAWAVAEERDDYAAAAKAYSAAMDDASDGERVFRMRVDELSAAHDRQLAAMDSLRREIGVRDRMLRSMHHRVTEVVKVDTVVVPELVMTANVDTVIDDGWVRTELSLSPGKIGVGTRVRNETTIIVHGRRETVRPPRRFFLFRLFQRKHTVVTVTAVEGNPWCETREYRSVEVVD